MTYRDFPILGPVLCVTSDLFKPTTLKNMKLLAVLAIFLPQALASIALGTLGISLETGSPEPQTTVRSPLLGQNSAAG
jgi:hypothetical protein